MDKFSKRGPKRENESLDVWDGRGCCRWGWGDQHPGRKTSRGRGGVWVYQEHVHCLTTDRDGGAKVANVVKFFFLFKRTNGISYKVFYFRAIFLLWFSSWNERFHQTLLHVLKLIEQTGLGKSIILWNLKIWERHGFDKSGSDFIWSEITSRILRYKKVWDIAFEFCLHKL